MLLTVRSSVFHIVFFGYSKVRFAFFRIFSAVFLNSKKGPIELLTFLSVLGTLRKEHISTLFVDIASKGNSAFPGCTSLIAEKE